MVTAGRDGAWVAERLGVGLTSDPGALGLDLHLAVGLAVRRNPRRVHLLVSTLLGKHVPTDPRLVQGSGRLLGLLVAGALDPDGPGAAARRAVLPQAAALLEAALTAGGKEAATAAEGLLALVEGVEPPDCAGRVAVLGYAETATGLGHAVADAVRAPYLHSTRRPVPGLPALEGFEEEHSHAPGHLLLPERPELITGAEALVLVDDEFSTGRTVLNTVRALTRIAACRHVVLASLVDVRSAADREMLAAEVGRLGARLDVVSLASGRITLPEGLSQAAARLLETIPAAPPAPASLSGPRAAVHRVDVGAWPAGARDGGRHGFEPRHRDLLEAALRRPAAEIAGAVRGDRILVLGFEELMHAPQRLALELCTLLGPTATVRSGSTTRSPVMVVDQPGYPIRSRIAFPAHDDPDDGPGERYAYNVLLRGDGPAGDADRFTDVVLVVDEPADTAALLAPGGPVEVLRDVCGQVHLVVLPSYRGEEVVGTPAPAPGPLRGPGFGSYRPDEVGWLLKDLSAVELEAPLHDREDAIQAGRAHYAESLPVEYQPDAEYQRLFHAALEAGADRIAQAVGVVAEQVLARRGEGLVLVSLARAGTPVGVLMRRWLALAHGLDVPHYAVSIVRGRGIDQVALDWLARRHDPRRVVFVDGWTGKGMIARELAAALDGDPRGFDPDLAVLADPGHCVRVFGTREDFLIPSACLNSTVSGLVSRTVLNAEHIGPGDFHGAKFYRELGAADVSGTFLDAVSARFGAVAEAVARQWPELAADTAPPTWAGWRVVERISREFGVHDPNLVKPGVGETTRVLLRRVPWKVLVDRAADAEAGAALAHVRLLAAQRGVDVVEVDGLGYRCVGLIRPRTVPTGGPATGAGR